MRNYLVVAGFALIVFRTVCSSETAGSNFLHLTLNKIQEERFTNSDGENGHNEELNFNTLQHDDEQHFDIENNQTKALFTPAQVSHDEQHIEAKPDLPIEDLIKIIFSKNQGVKSSDFEVEHYKLPLNNAQKEYFSNLEVKPEEVNEMGQKPEGYYYYFYPLKNMNQDTMDQMPPDLANMLKTMMPQKNNKMKNTLKGPMGGPLFGAMLLFVGTAMVFIVTILLMPRVRIVKVNRSFPVATDSYMSSLHEKITELSQKL